MALATVLPSLFGARPPAWLVAFDDDPSAATDALLRDRFNHGSLNAAEPGVLLAEWANRDWQGADFVPRLDAALAAWVEQTWGRGLVDLSTNQRMALALAWCRLANVVAAMPALDGTVRTLRQRFEQRESYLGPLSTGPTRDPLGRYLLALARHQTDRALWPEWQRLCGLPGDLPYYYGAYGIAGLYGLPPANVIFRLDVADGLVELFEALARRVDTGRLGEAPATKEALSLGRLSVAASSQPEVWRSVWASVLTDLRPTTSQRAVDWLDELTPGLAAEVVERREELTKRREALARARQAWWEQVGRVRDRLRPPDAPSQQAQVGKTSRSELLRLRLNPAYGYIEQHANQQSALAFAHVRTDLSSALLHLPLHPAKRG